MLWLLLWFLHVHTCAWYILVEVFGEVVTTIDYVNSFCSFIVYWKGMENQRSSKWALSYETMSGFIITFICHFTHYSLITSEYQSVSSSTSFNVTSMHQILDFLTWIRAFFFLLTHRGGVIPSWPLNICKGQPFLYTDQVSLLWFPRKCEATSGIFFPLTGT